MVREKFEEWLDTFVSDVAEDIDQERADRFKDLFERSNYARQKDLAEELGVETRTVQRWLAGGTISKRYWKDLTTALETSTRYLIFGEELGEQHDETQLDHIEAMLTAVMDHLGVSLPDVQAPDDPGDHLEAELADAARSAKQSKHGNAATGQTSPRKRRAS